ncbi:MAG: heavy-metal-associated domain-containing protein [Bryobacteraceae bacterium]
MTRFAYILALSLPAFAQLHEVSIKLGGIECASCSLSIPKALKKIKGVETAAFNEKDAAADIRLAEKNTVTLDQVRDALKGLGYTPEVANVRARGRIRRGDKGALYFELEGTDVFFNAVPVTEVGLAGKLVEITGIATQPRGRGTAESLLIYTMKPVESEAK